MNARHLGKTGEELARRFLLRKGYQILITNYRSRLGEVDIVCEDGDTVVFVEVKTRRTGQFGTPAEAVTFRKQQRLQRLAEEFLISRGLEGRGVRFDVLSVNFNREAQPVIEHLIGAF